MSSSVQFISVDDHVVEPPDLWTNRLPARYRDVGPRLSRERITEVANALTGVAAATDQWCDIWRYESLAWPFDSSYGAVSMDQETFRPGPTTYDALRPGCYSMVERLADMDQNQMVASLCFPTFPRFCGQTFLEADDKELALLCVKAFNDWMIEEWHGPSNGRLLGLTLIPLWDPTIAAAEIRRTAAAGAKAVAFCELPARLGLPSLYDPSRYWDPVFNACEDTGSVLAMHIGSSSSLPRTSDDSPPPVTSNLISMNSMGSLADFIWSGTLERFPSMKLLLAEAQAGWIPYIIERADKIWDSERGLSARGQGYHDAYGITLKERPSSYYYRQVFSCIYDDEHALRNIDVVGEHNVLFEVDYPHVDSTWPNTHLVIDQAAALLDPNQLENVLWKNAARLFDLDYEVLRSASASGRSPS